MKPIPAFVLALSIILLLSAYTTQSAAAPTTVRNLLALTVTTTLTPQATTKPTSAVPSPIPTVAYQKNCITIEEELPDDLKLDGALILSDDWGRLSMYHLDLMSRRRSPFPNSAHDEYASLSPDGKWLAYLRTGYDEKGRQKDRILQIANAEGRHLDMSYWGLNWQYLVGWQDKSHLILAAPGYPGGDYIILNPFTMEKKVVDIDIPDFGSAINWYYPEPVFPNSNLSHWVTDVHTYDPYYVAWRLLNSNGWKTLWEGANNYRNFPKWSPDGQYFTIMGELSAPVDNEVNWMLLRINLEGSVVPLTNIIGEIEPKISWSPDSKHLAGWMHIDPNSNENADQLVLIDVEKPVFIDLCYVNDESWYGNRPPVWSPDGHFLAVAVGHSELLYTDLPYRTLFWDTAIIDLKEYRGYILARNAQPEVWMRKPQTVVR